MNIRIFLGQFLLFVVISFHAVAQNGESVFKAKCGACHTVGKGKLVGPDLKDVEQRYDEEWLHEWIKSSQTMVKAGDEKAVKAYNDNNQMVMPDQDVSDEEINQILEFIANTGANVSATPAVWESPVKELAPKESIGNGSLVNYFGFSTFMVLFLLFLSIIMVWISIMIRKAIKAIPHQS